MGGEGRPSKSLLFSWGGEVVPAIVYNLCLAVFVHVHLLECTTGVSVPADVVSSYKFFCFSAEPSGVFSFDSHRRELVSSFVFCHGMSMQAVLTFTERSTHPHAPFCDLVHWKADWSDILNPLRRELLRWGDPCAWSASGRVGVAAAAVRPYMSRKRWAQRRLQQP